MKMKLGELLAHATEFTFRPEVPEFDGVFSDDPLRLFAVIVRKVPDGRWQIRQVGESPALWSSAYGCWESGPHPAEGLEQFWGRTRYTFEAAIAEVSRSLAFQAEAARLRFAQRAARLREAAGS